MLTHARKKLLRESGFEMEKWIGTAGVCVSNNRILMVLQGTMDEPKRWSVPSGGLEVGETLEECCVREVKEETGYDAEIERFLYKKEGEDREVHYFQLQIIGGKPTIQDPDELIYAVDWKSLEDLKELSLSFEEDRRWLIDFVKQSENNHERHVGMHWTVEKVQDFKELSLFLAAMNRKKETHIGFCGEQPDEILQTLQEDFVGENGGVPFFIARDQADAIVAAIGLDIDASYAEVWGPFNQTVSMDIQDALWNALIKANPSVDTYAFFINQENVRQQIFMKELGAKKKGEHLKLLINKHDFEQVQVIKSTPFEQEGFKAFEQLHNETFPNTYYDAQTIVERLSDENILKILKNELSELQGYAYFEIDTDMAEASLEYIGISKAFQNKGLGTMLLKEAVSEMFAFPNIKEIALVVQSINSPANHIYMKAGFKQEDTLINYQL